MNASDPFAPLPEQYRCLFVRRHIRRDGSETFLAVWESLCAQCGEPFTCTTPAAATRFQPNRRCAKHNRPGQRVRRT